jgi:hypothetical protein
MKYKFKSSTQFHKFIVKIWAYMLCLKKSHGKTNCNVIIMAQTRVFIIKFGLTFFASKRVMATQIVM